MKKIKVKCYSRYKGEEKPLFFVTKEDPLRVEEILEIKLEEDSLSKERRRIFTIRAEDGGVYTLVHREVQNEWVLMGASENARG